MVLKGYIGSYDSINSKRILQFSFDEESEKFLEVKAIFPWSDSKYMSLRGNDMISVAKEDQQAGIGWYHRDSGIYEQLFLEKQTSCFVNQDDRFIYTANYHEGTVKIYTKDHFQLYRNIIIQQKAGCHQVLLHGHYLLVPCLLLDKLMIYDRDQDFALINEISFPLHSGPRHGVFQGDQICFVVSELSNELYQFRVHDGMEFELLHKISLVTSTQVNVAAAAIRLSKDQRFLYISLRGANEIVVVDAYRLCIVQRIDSGGDHPRDISLSPDMNYLFVLNRFSNHLAVFKRDKMKGTLMKSAAGYEAVEGVCIVFDDQEENDDETK